MPALDELLEGLVAPDWLQKAYAELADIPVPFCRAAALGLVARLWEPTNERDRDTLHEWLRAGRGTVASRVKDYLAESEETITFGDFDDLIKSVHGATDRLIDRLGSCWDYAERLDLDAIVNFVDLARRERDDLESVRAVLWMLGARETVADIDEALWVVNRIGWMHRSMFNDVTADRAIASRASRLVAADETAALEIAAADAITDRIAAGEQRFVAVLKNDPSAWWGIALRSQ